MAFSEQLTDLAKRALETAKARNRSIITAESCTAGKLSGLLSEAPGASALLHGGFVAYTKENKSRALGPEPDEDGNPVGRVCIAVAHQGASPVRIENRYGDIGRDAVQERAMMDALNALIDAMNKQ
jgi:nicotinamide mononucleotide (NMN) deamidase PncC